MNDAIVVGARCAGAPTAMLLAHTGYRVLLLDRAAFPSDTLSTHSLHQPGRARRLVPACALVSGPAQRVPTSACEATCDAGLGARTGAAIASSRATSFASL